MVKRKRVSTDPRFWSRQKVGLWLKSHPVLASLCSRFRLYSGALLTELTAVDLGLLIPDDIQRQYFEIQLRLLFRSTLKIATSGIHKDVLLTPIIERPYIDGISVKFTSGPLFSIY